ncbi:DUF475 domain-containing protein [Brevirhabdus sp.]|uniref:DUF475 domain-containing protein n=1 Tax=Brevirhabdus sp. TaxID=2004514 RepID=UPI004058A0AE
MTTAMGYFRWAFAVTALGLVLAFWLGWVYSGSLLGALPYLLVGTILAILEISLSFDNAIVNANKLDRMTPVWRQRFLTWGILIAVFGMRIVFPLAVVVIAAEVTPWTALSLAATQPQAYADLMQEAHLPIAAFGGTFLMMVSLSYFIDPEKEVDWIGTLERRLRRCADLRGIDVALVLVVVMIFTMNLPEEDQLTFLFAAVFGLITFCAVELLGQVLDSEHGGASAVRAGGLGAFLYLEVLDASFSFDGVIGAFALTQNLFLIAIGLGIGAMYVRSMTIMLVEKGTLTQFRYLEHGAFWSILALAFIMFAQSLVHVPEVITGLIGAGLIGVSFYSSIRWNRRQESA